MLLGRAFKGDPAWDEVDSSMHSNCNLIVCLRVKNPTDGVPSTASEWRIECKDKLIPADSVDLYVPTQPAYSILAVPLPPGVETYGTIGFQLDPKLFVQLKELRDWRIGFKDSADRPHYAELPSN